MFARTRLDVVCARVCLSVCVCVNECWAAEGTSGMYSWDTTFLPSGGVGKPGQWQGDSHHAENHWRARQAADVLDALVRQAFKLQIAMSGMMQVQRIQVSFLLGKRRLGGGSMPADVAVSYTLPFTCSMHELSIEMYWPARGHLPPFRWLTPPLRHSFGQRGGQAS